MLLLKYTNLPSLSEIGCKRRIMLSIETYCSKVIGQLCNKAIETSIDLPYYV